MCDLCNKIKKMMCEEIVPKACEFCGKTKQPCASCGCSKSMSIDMGKAASKKLSSQIYRRKMAAHYDSLF